MISTTSMLWNLRRINGEKKTNPMEEFREALKENAIDDIIWKMKKWNISLEDIEKRMNNER